MGAGPALESEYVFGHTGKHGSKSMEINIRNVAFHKCKMYLYQIVLKRKKFCDCGYAVALILIWCKFLLFSLANFFFFFFFPRISCELLSTELDNIFTFSFIENSKRGFL